MWLFGPSFFGQPTSLQNAWMEEVFNLVCYLGLGWNEARSLPVAYRRWLIQRINKEIEKQANDGDGESTLRPAHQNTPFARQMQGLPPGARKF